MLKTGLLLIACCLIPSMSNAQIGHRSMGIRRTPGPGVAALAGAQTPTSEEKCQHFIDHPKGRLSDFATELADLRSCTDALDDNIPDPRDSNAEDALSDFKAIYNVSTPDQVNEQLITTHYLSRVLRRWANLDSATAADVMTSLDGIDPRLHTLMNYVGLLDPFAGSLVAGPAFGDTGKLSPGTTSTGAGATATVTTGTAATSAGSKTDPLAHIEWSSKHFGDESWSPVDFNLGGAFGLQPAMTLLTNPPAATTTAAASSGSPITSQYQSAFIWSLNARGNIHTGSTAETSSFFKAGQVRLLSGNGATIVDQGTNSTLQIPLNGNADRLAWFYEGGVEFNYYNKALEIVHAEKGQLDPAFNIAAAYKIDTRFKQSAGVVGFDSPDRRFVFRFMINGLKIFDRRPDTTTSKPWAISFGVEHERGFGANPIPSGTQIIIRGDVNLLKLINPKSGP